MAYFFYKKNISEHRDIYLKKRIFTFEDLLAYPKNLRQIHCRTTLLAFL